jgi:ribosomal protein S27AE
MMKSAIQPPEKLLDAVEEIAARSATLSPSQRSLLDSEELHIRSTAPTDGSREFTVWGLIEYLVFVRETDGSNHVIKYFKADWEAEVYKRLSLYRELGGDAEAREYWGPMVDVGYEAEKPIHTDSEIVVKVKPRITRCPKCGTENRLPHAPEPGKTYNCGKCKSQIWQQPRSNWILLEHFEATKEERKLREALEKNNPRIQQWVEANRDLNEALAGGSPGIIIKLRWLAFLLPMKACVSTSTDDIVWWQLLLISFGMFGIASVIDTWDRPRRIRNMTNKVVKLERELGGADRIKAEIEQIYSQWLESRLSYQQKV